MDFLSRLPIRKNVEEEEETADPVPVTQNHVKKSVDQLRKGFSELYRGISLLQNF